MPAVWSGHFPSCVYFGNNVLLLPLKNKKGKQIGHHLIVK